MNKVAFITGASSGLGRGFARSLAREGYAVALVARRADRLEELAGEIRAAGGQALVCVCDVSVRESVHAAVVRTESDLGPVDLLIANAGMSGITRVEAFDAGEIARIMEVNFFGALWAVECVLPGMLQRGSGQLVAIGSLAGYGGLPRTAAYSASKGALHNFMESLRIDLRGTGIDVTMITPGYVRSELTDRNRHRMPFLQDLDPSVEAMVDAIRRRKRLYTFPRPLSSIAWLAQILPAWLYDRLATKIRREKAPPEVPGPGS